MQNMNIDKKLIQNGVDIYNYLLYNNEVQQSLNDWVTVYNPITFELTCGGLYIDKK